MQKAVSWGLVISYIILFIAMGIMGIKIFDKNYDIVVESYIAFIFLLINCGCNIYRVFSNRCPHCGKIRLSNGKYCSHCGKEV